MRYGKFRVSFEVLHDLMSLPDDAKVVGIESESFGTFAFTVYVECPDFPEYLQAKGAVVPYISPTFRAPTIKDATALMRPVFCGWDGIPKAP